MRFSASTSRSTPLKLATLLKKRASLRRLLAREPVELVFVHGSLAKNRLKPLSDIDIAVLFKPKHVEYRQMGAALSKLESLFKRDDIDLMVLNHASPLACMQVLKNGKPLFCRSRKVLIQFRFRTIQRYLATKYLRDSFNRYLKTAILGGG